MKLYRETTLTFQSKRGDSPWEHNAIPVLELREGPWWAFLQERLFRCASSKIATHYVRDYTKERYLQIANYEGVVSGPLLSLKVYNKALSDEDMASLSKPVNQTPDGT